MAPMLTFKLDYVTLNILKPLAFVFALLTPVFATYSKKRILARKGVSQQHDQVAGNTVIDRYSTAMIVAQAFALSVGTCGFVLLFLGMDQADFYFLTLLSAAWLLLFRPKKEEVLELIRHAERSGMTKGISSVSQSFDSGL
jgi:hypothetical protein